MFSPLLKPKFERTIRIMPSNNPPGETKSNEHVATTVIMYVANRNFFLDPVKSMNAPTTGADNNTMT